MSKILFRRAAARALLLVSAAALTGAGMSAHAQQSETSETETSSPDDADRRLQTVTVTGIRGSLETAEALKRNSDGVVDAIAAEDIGDFPDENLAEALQRITGVQIERNGGEGTAISIRGLGPQFNTVLLNGRTAPSDAGDRGFNFLVLSSELVSKVEVAKTPTVDNAEGGVGGTVFVSTPKPLDVEGFRLLGSAATAYDSQREEWAPRASFLVSNTFANERVGLLLSASLTERKFSNQIYNQNGYRVAPANFQQFATANGLPIPVFEPENIQIDATTSDRERTNVYGAAQFQATPELVLTADAYFSDYEDFTYRTRIQIPPNRGGYTAIDLEAFPDGDLSLIDTGNSFSNVDNRNFTTASELTVTGLNADWSSGAWSWAADFSYSKAEQNQETLATIIDIPRNAANRNIFDYRTGNRMPDISFINYDPSNYGSHILRFIRVDIQDTSDEETAFRFDAEYELDNGILSSVQAGIRYSDRSFARDEITTENCNFNPCITGLTPGIQNILPAGAVTSFPVSNFLGDEAGGIPRTWATANPILLRNHFLPNGLPPFAQRPASFVEVDEEISAAYLRANFEWTLGVPFSGDVGLRYVETKLTSAGFVPMPIGLDLFSRPGDVTFFFGAPELVEAGRTYDQLLWNANLKFDLTDEIVSRLAAARVMARPEIGFLSPGFSSLSRENRQASSGNPDLDPFLATQFDATLEWYTDNAGSYTAALFYKDIDAVTQTLTTIVPITFQNITQDYNFTRPENAEGGNIWGFELAAVRDFDFLPRPFDKMGVVANYTYAESSIESTNPVVTNQTFSLEGLSKNNANLILYYEDDRLGVRLAYNYRDSFLDQTLGVFQLPEFRDSVEQLDMSANYRINDRFSIFAEGLNLTNEEQFQYSGDPSRVRYIEYSGTRFVIGGRASF